jgi:hypothetical protein
MFADLAEDEDQDEGESIRSNPAQKTDTSTSLQKKLYLEIGTRQMYRHKRPCSSSKDQHCHYRELPLVRNTAEDRRP